MIPYIQANCPLLACQIPVRLSPSLADFRTRRTAIMDEHRSSPPLQSMATSLNGPAPFHVLYRNALRSVFAATQHVRRRSHWSGMGRPQAIKVPRARQQALKDLKPRARQRGLTGSHLYRKTDEKRERLRGRLRRSAAWEEIGMQLGGPGPACLPRQSLALARALRAREPAELSQARARRPRPAPPRDAPRQQSLT